MKTIATLFIVLASTIAFGQVRMISHISKAAGGFTPGVIVANLDDLQHDFSLTPYDQQGNMGTTVSSNISASTTKYFTLTDIFGTEDVSHIAITGDEIVRVSTTYESTNGNGSPAHIHESDVQSTLWRVYPGDWDAIWDGMAVVNTGTAKTSVIISQVSKNGVTIKSETAIVDLAPFSKGLFVFGSAFSEDSDSHFEIKADQPLAITSIRGSNNNAFLWENAAVSVTTSSNKSIYTRFTNLNKDAVPVSGDWTELATTDTVHHFTKMYADTVIEVQVSSRFSSGNFDDVQAISFHVRVDGVSTNLTTPATIHTTSTIAPLNFSAVFENLDAGDHTVSIWAVCSPGNSASSGVVVDPFGWGGSIILKETR